MKRNAIRITSIYRGYLLFRGEYRGYFIECVENNSIFTSVTFYVSSVLNLRINSMFRFLQKQMSGVLLITSHFLKMETFPAK